MDVILNVSGKKERKTFYIFCSFQEKIMWKKPSRVEKIGILKNL